jgi:hypothetical protein
MPIFKRTADEKCRDAASLRAFVAASGVEISPFG